MGVAMLRGSQAALVLSQVFSVWHESLNLLKQDRKMEQWRLEMKVKNDVQTKKMLGVLAGSQDELLVKALFSTWAEVVSEKRKERELEALKRSMKSKGQEHTKRMLGMLVSSQAEGLLKTLFSVWADLAKELRQEREHQRFMETMKAKGAESSKRMLAMLMGSQAEVLLKTTFSGWREYVVEMNKFYDMEEMQQALKQKGQESSKRMLGMLLGSQAEVLLKAAMGAWREMVVEAKIQRLREDGMKKRGKEEESRRRMLTMLAGSQGSLLLKSTFTAWT